MKNALAVLATRHTPGDPIDSTWVDVYIDNSTYIWATNVIAGRPESLDRFRLNDLNEMVVRGLRSILAKVDPNQDYAPIGFGAKQSQRAPTPQFEDVVREDQEVVLDPDDVEGANEDIQEQQIQEETSRIVPVEFPYELAYGTTLTNEQKQELHAKALQEAEIARARVRTSIEMKNQAKTEYLLRRFQENTVFNPISATIPTTSNIPHSNYPSEYAYPTEQVIPAEDMEEEDKVQSTPEEQGSSQDHPIRSFDLPS